MRSKHASLTSTLGGIGFWRPFWVGVRQPDDTAGWSTDYQIALGAFSLQDGGLIRGVVYDKDFDAPLAGAQVTIAETGRTVVTNDEGNFVFGQVAPGEYTLVFSKDGYARQVKAGVIVSAGQLVDADASLTGEVTEMEEFVVQDVQIAGTEASLLELRAESPALIDSIGADMMNKAGASDAAAALNLVTGATVQDGKFAVIRGLPDRYVSSQMNGVRLPSADEDKRAVELDQFPAAVIESVQVSKTFTPDQQGDASGGAVNVVLKGIPDQNILQLKGQVSYNSQVSGRRDFLTYDGGGVNQWGRDDGGRRIQTENIGQNWDGAVGVTRGEAPIDYKWSAAAGGKHEFDNGVKIGGFVDFFYERDSSFEEGIDDSFWVTTPGGPMVPETTQGTPEQGTFKTKLFDKIESSESVQWSGLGTFGIESENHSLGMTYLYTRTAEDTVTLAEDTRGKEFFFPGYDPNDPFAVGNELSNRDDAPYVRTETLDYTERTTSTLQFKGKHKLPIDDLHVGDLLAFSKPEFDWTIANSSADLFQPDKRQFGSIWIAPSFDPGAPPFLPPSILPAVYEPFKPAESFTLGNVQRIFKEIDEESEQYFINLKFPFKVAAARSDSDGYLKFGVFDDQVTRRFDQETFSNFEDGSTFNADFDDFWSAHFPFQVDDPGTPEVDEGHPITDGPPFVDVDYEGEQEISAWYYMVDLPLTSYVNIIGGMRFESTKIEIVNFPEEDALWFPEGASAGIALEPGAADVHFEQDDQLPSIGFEFKPIKAVTLRGSYSETVARQTFKELTPILQQEFLGGDVFIGNPELRMSAVKNYDLRVDYTPYEGGLISASYFKKDITDPIEYVQRPENFTFTTPVNYPVGELSGFEFEVRQQLGNFWDKLEGLAVGGNATFIDAEVFLPDDEIAAFEASNFPMTSRDMTNAPEYLYNLYLTYEAPTGTQLALFYTVRGDTLVAGAGQSIKGNFVPDVYEKEFGTLNFTLTQKLGKYLKLQFQAKNLTNPSIEEVYRSEFIGDDVTKTSFKKGIDYSIGLSAEFTF
ncbi:MAG: TonB-dependent receptor [Phycisphaerales bacterium]|nr:TonB-dependent receptor [Phycisphaerales bacterium]